MRQLTLGFDEMYQALTSRDSSYDGTFYTCVKTTGIFCRPGCSARNPKKENVEFVRTVHEALMRGYRPCKVCQPMHLDGSAPPWLSTILEEMEKNPDKRFTDGDLESRGLHPNRVRRWFQKHYNMTFQGYQRSLRISQAFQELKQGEKVVTAAFDAGYDSLSGFTEAFKKLTQFSPSDSKDRQVVHIDRIPTPLGPMIAGATNEGICLLEFVDRKMLNTQLTRLSQQLKAMFLPGQHPHFSQLRRELSEYFGGQRKSFSLPIHRIGSTFQNHVWDALEEIPYGATRSYLQQADRIGNVKAIRAVAKANGDNKISIIIPCHRVIGHDGKLVGYGGGLWRKQFLLELERRNG